MPQPTVQTNSPAGDVSRTRIMRTHEVFVASVTWNPVFCGRDTQGISLTVLQLQNCLSTCQYFHNSYQCINGTPSGKVQTPVLFLCS